MPSPANAKIRRLQQSIDEILVGTRRLILNEGLDLTRRWRQPGQVIRHPTNKRLAVRIADRLDPVGLPRIGDEPIDVIERPGVTGIDRDGAGSQGAKRPEFTSLFNRGRHQPDSGTGRLVDSRIDRSPTDPLLESVNGLLGQLSTRRHFDRNIVVAHGSHQQAVAGITRRDGRTGIAALDPPGAGIQTEPTPLLLGAMAIDAVLDQSRANVFLKKSLLGGIIRLNEIRNDRKGHTGKQQSESLPSGGVADR